MLCACTNAALDTEQATGSICVQLATVSVDIDGSKAVPSQLYRPEAQDFRLTIVKNSNGRVKYSGPYTNTPIQVSPGNYTVIAEYGPNNPLGIDEPYYRGSTVVDVQADVEEPVPANIHCKIGNSLISVKFGKDQEQQERFKKYFSSVSMSVIVGAFSQEIKSENTQHSIYIKADSKFKLEFKGALRADNDRIVYYTLEADNLPSSLEAGQHLVVTLNSAILPSGVVVNVEKAEIEYDEINQHIPYEWLPMPSLTASHAYASDGTLMGTDLATTLGYPGCIWTAKVKNSAGTLVRTIIGEGALTSAYSSSQEWPYLPAGDYTATFSYEYDGKTIPIEGKERHFTINSPEAINIEVSGSTAHSRYMEHKVSQANATEKSSIEDINIKLKLSDKILTNSNYTSLINSGSSKCWVDENQGAAANFIGLHYGGISGAAAGDHTLHAIASFDGAQGSNSCSFFISGLPCSFNPPTREAGWRGHSTIDWSDGGGVRLGRNSVDNPQYLEYSNINVPKGTKIYTDYNVTINGATVQTTLSLSFGSYTYFSEKTSYMKKENKQGNAIFTTDSDTNLIKVNNSYGSGQTCSWVYSLSYRYAE